MKVINRFWKLVFVVWLLQIALVAGSWNTLYSYEDGHIYVHLKDNNLLQLNFSITGFHNLQYSDYTESELNIANNQQVTTLATPPTNSTLFLISTNLYAIHDDSAVQNGGQMSLSKLINNAWTKVSLDFSKVGDDIAYYNYPTALTVPGNNHTVYIYGGIDQDTLEISNRLLSIDVSTMKVANISTATKPQAFYGAANVLAPDPQTQLIIGGQSNIGWLNMYQLASWDFSAGWSFFQVQDDLDTVTVNSRKFALPLPIFNPLPNNTAATINDLLQISEVFLIAGEEDSGSATPTYAKLSMKTNDWIWNTTLSIDIEESEILGAAMIFNTLVTVNSSSVQKRDGSTSYSVNLFDVNTFQSVSSLKTNVVTKLQSPMAASSSKQSVQLKAILGTLIPLIALVLAGFGFYIYKKRNGKQNEDEDIDYQLGAFDNESVFSFHSTKIKPYVQNDSHSTLDAASIDSWFKKRELFDKDRLQSTETLTDEATMSDVSEMKLITKPTAKLQVTPGGPKLHIQTNFDRSVSKLKKSFSFRQPNSMTSPLSAIPTIKENQVIRNGTLKYDNDEQPSDSPFADQESVDITNFEEDSDVDDRMDVQFLVSSKRRSILKVVNPEMDEHEAFENDKLIEEESNLDITEEDERAPLNGPSRKTSIRQRIPSGKKLYEP